jgi:LysR family nitrogen assimilation transcriptional regulator
MNLKQLEYFVRVAELGSFSKASIVLNIAQPALSRQVRLLETDLRTTLLIRNGRGVALTELGNRLFQHGTSILQQVQDAAEDIESARNEPFGRITMGLPPSISRKHTPALVETFSRVLPKARLSIVEGLSAHLAEWISTGRIDLGLVHNAASSPVLDATPVIEESIGLISCKQRGDNKIKPGPVLFSKLPSYPLILPERGHAMRQQLETTVSATGIKLNIAFEISGVPSILDLVAAGYGYAVLTQTSIDVSNTPDAFLLHPFEAPALTSTLCIVTSARKPITPLIKQASSLLRKIVIHNKPA